MTQTNTQCLQCKAKIPDVQMNAIYPGVKVCDQCANAPDLEKIAGAILATTFHPDGQRPIIDMIKGQAMEIERLENLVDIGDYVAKRFFLLNEQAKQDAATIAKLKDELFELEAESFASEQTIDELTQQIEELKAAKRSPIVGKL